MTETIAAAASAARRKGGFLRSHQLGLLLLAARPILPYLPGSRASSSSTPLSAR